jgi:hypothetical protein
VNARPFPRLLFRWRANRGFGVRSTSHAAFSDLHDLPAMTIQHFLPIFGLKIGVAGGGLLVLVIQDGTDQVQRGPVPHQPRSHGSTQIMNPEIVKSCFFSDAAPHRIQVGEGLSRDRSANDEGVIFQFRDQLEPRDGGAAQWR